MHCRYLLLACVLGVGCTPPQTEDLSRVVVFQIDMRTEIAEGRFDPAIEFVGVRGGIAPLNWAQTIVGADPERDGIYEARVPFASEADSVVQYKFKVDRDADLNGGWENDPNRRVIVTSGETVVARAFNEPVGDIPPSFAGDIRHHPAVPSVNLGRVRDVWVYLPPGYSEQPDRRYPVLYLHDGQNVFDYRSAGAEWRFDEAAEAMISSGEIRPVIIVGVANTGSRGEEYTPSTNRWRYELQRTAGEGPAMEGTFAVVDDEDGLVLEVRKVAGQFQYEAMLPQSDFWQPLVQQDDGTYLIPGPDISLMITDTTGGSVQQILATRSDQGGGGAAYGRFITDELMPMIDATYRTLRGPDNTSLGGSSLGGLITMYLGSLHPDVFGGLLVVSPSVWWDDEAILDIVADAGKPAGQRIWLDVGTDESAGMLRGARRLRGVLREAGWTIGHDLMYTESEGASHSEGAWASRVPNMLRFLYGGSVGSMDADT